MFEKKGLWQETHEKNLRAHRDKLLWLGLASFFSILIGTLFFIFSDQVFAENTYLDIARATGILVLVSGGLIYARGLKFGEVVRNALIWIGILSFILFLYTYRAEVSRLFYRIGGEVLPGLPVSTSPNEAIIIANQNGHFYVDGRANGERLRFMVDTGASDIVLSPQAAIQIGIDLKNLKFTRQYRTANGIVLGAPYKLKKFAIGPFDFNDIKVSINQVKMSESLLGMSFLRRLQSFEFQGRKLYLRK